MKVVVATDEGTVSFNYTWLPTWVGMNDILLAELAEQLLAEFAGEQMTEAVMHAMNERAKTLLVERLKMPTLMHLLDALERVRP